MRDEENPGQAVQLETWNMAVPFSAKLFQQIAFLIDGLNDPIQDGIPQWQSIVQKAKVLCRMIKGAYLNDKEKEFVVDEFYKFFDEYPVEELQGVTILPSIIEQKLFELIEWSHQILKAKGALVPPTFDPEMVL